MRAISLWEPWASAMRFGVKQNETRSWPTTYRGDLIICAARRKMTKDEIETQDIFLPEVPKDSKPPYGCALCVVELFDCVPAAVFHRTDLTDKDFLPLSDRECALGDYTIGRWIWLTRKLRPLKEPVLITGRQGLWIPDGDTVIKIRANL